MRLKLLPLLALCLIVRTAGIVRADEQSDLVARLHARVPQLTRIFSDEKAGEGLDGVVVALPEGLGRAALTEEDEKLVRAENEDRNALFGVLADANGVSARQLASLRAEQIRAILKGSRSAWYQDPDDKKPGGFAWVSPGGGDHGQGGFVWTKPGAKRYKDDLTTTNDDNVPGFSSYFVLETKKVADSQWYRVGTLASADKNASDKGLGWMKDKDVLPQPHRLVLSFTTDANRDKLEVFRTMDDLVNVASLPAAQRAAEYDRLWTESHKKLAEGKPLPANFPLAAVEPEVAPEIFQTFYVMPLLKADPYQKQLNWDGPVRLVKLASASLKSKGPAKTNTLDMDVVFVLDTTGSMQPYIDEVLKMCKQMATSLEDGKTRFRFGCWGYQDDPVTKPGNIYLTQNFTPKLQTVAEIAGTLDGVKARGETKDEPEEALLDGLVDAILKTNWRPHAARMIVLVGDEAPLPQLFRGSIHPTVVQNPNGTNDLLKPNEASLLTSVRGLASENQVSILSMHLQTPKNVARQARAAQAYTRLSINSELGGGGAFFPIPAANVATFGREAGNLINAAINSIRNMAGENVALPQISKEDLNKLDFMLKPMMRDLVREKEDQQTPDFQIGWALSKGLKNTEKSVFQVCVFATHKELDACVSNIERLIQNQQQNGRLSNKDLYEGVQGLVRRVFFPTLAGTDAQLPYKSQLLETSFDTLNDSTPSEQNEFWDLLGSKVNALRAKLDEGRKDWGPITSNAPPDEWVTAISIDGIP